MNVSSKPTVTRPRFHEDAIDFVFEGLRYVQRDLGGADAADPDDETAHISGQQLSEGLRRLALEQFGLMALTVFDHWGVRSTEDFGRIVFEMIEEGRMKKTPHDQLSDFYDVFDFEEAFDRDFRVDTTNAFRH